MKTKKTLAKQVQDIINSSGKSRYQIAKDAGIRESTIQRVMHEDWGSLLETANNILNAIDYELIIKKKKK